jgi:ubiquinone/menaquinone biosynthesis C-methylase UbiE
MLSSGREIIEKIPITANTADVIVSNCVLNLVPNKDGVMKEIYRTLKPGAHFSISDIVLEGELPTENKRSCRNVCRLRSRRHSKAGLSGN